MSKHFLKYPKGNISKARRLRREQTDAERKLWSLVRNNRLGVHFRRQVPIGSYIVDFLAIEPKLVVELDGSQHYTEAGVVNDLDRDAYLKSEGFTVLRYSNVEFLKNTDAVVQDIFDHIQKNVQPK